MLGPAVLQSKVNRRLAGGAFEEMTEGKLVAESQRRGNLCNRFIGGRQQRGRDVRSPALEITGKRFSHGRLKQIGTILLRVAQKLGQEFERQAFMEVAAYKHHDLR